MKKMNTQLLTPNKTMINELSDAHTKKKNLSKWKSSKRSLRNSWRSYKT
jgi:hypothetical protein